MGRVWVSCGERERLRMNHVGELMEAGTGQETRVSQGEESHKFTLDKLLFCLLCFHNKS